jgi:hypothetical protein
LSFPLEIFLSKEEDIVGSISTHNWEYVPSAQRQTGFHSFRKVPRTTQHPAVGCFGARGSDEWLLSQRHWRSLLIPTGKSGKKHSLSSLCAASHLTINGLLWVFWQKYSLDTAEICTMLLIALHCGSSLCS